MTHFFISDEEFSRCSDDAALVAERADAFIRGLYTELETVKAQADAASITAEQTCALLEQKYLSLSDEFSKLESHSAQLQSSLDNYLSDLAEVQSQKHQLNLLLIGKDGEIERLQTELSEIQKTKRELVELVEHKNLDISEKNNTIKNYLDKIVSFSESAAKREARLGEIESELVRSQAACARLVQEKELIERHNIWLNDELTAKVDTLMELRRSHSDFDADMSAKVSNVQRQLDECSRSLQWNKDRVRELEIQITSLQEELRSSKETATLNEERLSAELSTVNKLVQLYKESSDEWSKKAGGLEGVVKALETHLTQVESNCQEKLEKEESLRKQFEKEASNLKMKLEECEAEIETSRKENELNLLPLSRFTTDRWINSLETDNAIDNNHMLVPTIPLGVSGTAFAASLLRDGWSLAKMYGKYQETADSLRHEQLGRKEAEAVLQRVLYELEDKAEVILDERAEHERMAEAYSMINKKLQNSTSEQANLEKAIQELKADLRRHERDYSLIQKENIDLQKQVTVLLKECRDIQLRCGSTISESFDNGSNIATFEMNGDTDAEQVISERLLTFKDINGLVEQNVELRSLVRNLSNQLDDRELEFKEKLELEIKIRTDEAASKVAVVLQRAEEQGRMIDSLHSSVAMYKRLYEDEQNRNLIRQHPAGTSPGAGRTDLKLLLESSQEASRGAQVQAAERVKCLEEDLAKSRSETILLRSERDKLNLEATFTRGKLDSFVKEFEHQRVEMNGILARNVEFSQLLIDYQRKVRESSESLHAAEDISRKLSMEVSILKHEKEMMVSADKRANDEIRLLTERVFRLQASLDTIQTAEDIREEARVAERRKQEDYVKHLKIEWADAKKELQDERENVRGLMLEREKIIKNAMTQVENMGKELANALHAVAAAEARAAAAEARLSDLEKKLKSDVQVAEVDSRNEPSSLSNDPVTELRTAKEDIEKFKEEARANKDHMLQYKHIAQVNEDAMKQLEFAHESFKIEAQKLRTSMADDLLSLRTRVSDLENELISKSREMDSTASGKDEALASSFTEMISLKEEIVAKTSQITTFEIQTSALREELEREHQKWRDAQTNYERQVILQSETIQELTKTSQALAKLQEEAAELRRSADVHRSENKELKAKWFTEKTILEESMKKAEKSYHDLNEQNKILHSRLEALHIQLAEKDRNSAGMPSASTTSDQSEEAGLQNVISYLRRTKEIAETEISLLKQEKMRLQSQLESALKAAETAQTSLHAERATSKALLFTEEEIKSLQLQIREMNLLRESNIQLREENKHNFEECQKWREVTQKTRVEVERLETLLKEKQMEIESCKMIIETQKTEKYHLEKRVSELLDRTNYVDMEDYNQLKDVVQELKDKLNEKEAQLEQLHKLLSERLEATSKLEEDISKCRFELNERERRLNDIIKTEATLKLDVEKQKRVFAQYKRKFEVLSKEKAELAVENQALSKQMEDIKQGKKPGGDTTGEHAMEEKDAKIQILEKHMERLREELKKEKGDSQIEKNLRSNIEKDKTKLVNELEKHRRGFKLLSDEFEKLKLAKSNLPELLSGSGSDDPTFSFLSTVESLEKAAQSVMFNELEDLAVSPETFLIPDSSVSTIAGPMVPIQNPGFASSVDTGLIHLPGKATEEIEKRPGSLKSNIETRKIARKLLRPQLAKPDEPQVDVEMSEMEPPNTSGKSTAPVPRLARKRLSSSEVHEHLALQGLPSTEVTPVLKKSKGSDSIAEGAEAQPVEALESLGTLPASEEVSDIIEIPQGQEVIEMAREEVDVPKEQLSDHTIPLEVQTSMQIADENLGNSAGAEVETDETIKDQAELDSCQLVIESGSEREEGELPLDIPEIESSGHLMEITEGGDAQSESVAKADDIESVAATELEAGEINSPEAHNEDKNDEGDVIEEASGDVESFSEGTAGGLEKSGDGNDEVAGEIAQAEGNSGSGENTSSISVLDASLSRRASPPSAAIGEAREVRRISPPGNTSSSTTINLQERAKERAMLRQAGVVSSSPGRGRGRPAVRGRVVRGGRTARGGRNQPGEQN